MPLFVHLRTPAGIRLDETGIEYEGLEAAYLAACHAIPGVAGDLLRAGLDPMRCAFEVADADGGTLTEVPFTELVRAARAWVEQARQDIEREGRP